MTARIGIFGARSDHRGLANLTALIHRCLAPAKTVVVDMGKHSPTAFHPDAYGPDAITVTYDEMLAGTYDYGEFLESVDSVICFETPYEFRMFDEARARGVRTTLVLMAELDPYVRRPDLPRPDVVALPTEWMADLYPGCPVLPVPSTPWSHTPGDLVVHPSAWAMADRNGTRTVIDASRFTAQPVVVRGQAAPEQPWHRATVEVADLPDSKDLYAGAGLVVIPRRYGGLSLVMQEAMSAGLPLLVGEHDPYAHHLPAEARIRSTRARDLQATGGSIATWLCEPREVAERIDLVMGDDELRGYLADASQRWAEANSWENVRPMWDAVLGSVVPA